MRALDVGHGAGVQIEPFLAEDGVPAPADELMYNDQEPNCEMIDFRVHKSLRIIQASELGLQVDSSACPVRGTLRRPYLDCAKGALSCQLGDRPQGSHHPPSTSAEGAIQPAADCDK